MLQSQGLRAAAGRFPVLTFQSIGQSSSTNSATKSISLNIGTASSDRYVIVLVQWPAGNNRTINSATINGVSASIATNNSSSSLAFGNAAIFAKVTAGSGSQTISVTLSGTTNNATSGFAVYTLTGRTTLAFSSQNQSAIASATSRSTTLTVPADGLSLNWWISTSTPTSGSWSGSPSTPVKQSPITQRICSSAFENFSSASQSVTATFSHSNSIAVRLVSSSYTYT